MSWRGSCAVCAVVVLLWANACGSDSEDSGGNGTGGSGGGPSGGSGGSGGAATGGSGGAGGSGGTAGDASACGPLDLGASWQPAPYKPAKTQLGACTQALLDEFLLKCPGEVQPPCVDFGADADPAKAQCEQCLWSKSSDSAWSALVEGVNEASVLNQAGCVELLGGEGAAECAQALAASNQCVFESCRECTKQKAGLLDPTCVASAQTGVCKTLQAATNAACAAFGASHCMKLEPNSVTKTLAAFCGPGAGDAGAEAGGDAAADASLD